MRGSVRRGWRLVCLLGHLLLGVLAAHLVLAILKKISNNDPRHDQERVAQWWTRGMCRILGLRVEQTGEVSAGPTLFVANHISWLDTLVLQAALKATFVAKQEVRAWPVFGAMAARTGTLFLKRGDHTSSALLADHMTWGLMQKHSFVMFPEGTTTDGLSVQHFHARLFQAALRARHPVQAVAVAYPHPHGVHPLAPFVGDDTLLRHLWRLLGERHIDVKLTFCTPLAAAGLERRTLAQRARTQIVDALLAEGDVRQPAQQVARR